MDWRQTKQLQENTIFGDFNQKGTKRVLITKAKKNSEKRDYGNSSG